MSVTRADVADADLLTQAWSRRPGMLGWLGQCNHKAVGRRFIATAFTFFLVGGLLALIMRAQLAVPENDVVGPQTYDGLFTMHGTVMMFLFVVPMLEGLAIYVLPLQLGARDMPMPRLNAFGYWAYLGGGIFLMSSFLFGTVPDGGWYAYVPLTLREFSPGANLDVWLLGVTFVEISGVVASVEVIVLILRSRAPGMTLARMPFFAWANLVTSIMILSAFPPLIAASTMLELDRKFGTVFFDPSAGGSPLLWQHLFWWFGHPEVYIQLLPAVGIVGTIVAVAARRPMVARPFAIASLVAIGITSFGLWVHHMFASGLPQLVLQFFSAASFMIAVPTGVLIFVFLATIWRGTFRWDVPLLFTLGFVFIFVAGGITGVMVAVLPFNWQVHDSYFIVAHFHYVLVGGVVFPILGALYHWVPKVTGRMLDRRLGLWSFWLAFVGFNVTFFPQHILGLLGMVRRMWTYEEGLGWDGLNLLSSTGSGLLGLGVLLTAINLAVHVRRGAPTGDDPWGGGTLEWATTSPPEPYNFDRIPVVSGPEPLWEAAAGEGPRAPWPAEDELDWQRELAEPDGLRREVLITSGLDARPEHILELPGHSLWPLMLAVAIGVFLSGALFDLVWVAGFGVVAVAASWIGWLWPRRTT